MRRASILKGRVGKELLRSDLTPAQVDRRLRSDLRVRFDASDYYTQLFAHWLDEAPADLRAYDAPPAAAPALLERRITLLGKEFDFPGDIDWHREPFFDVRWPKRFVGALPDVRRGSDLVLLWHLNRMMYLLDVSHAFRSTGNTDYADLWVEWVTSWTRANPHLVGMNWRSRMEAGIRLVVWSFGLRELGGSSALSTRALRRIVPSLIRQAEFVANGFSLRRVPNNHLIGEAATLYTFAVMWPVLEASRPWRERCREILTTELDRQVLPDGMDFENAFNYHANVLDYYLLFCLARHLEGETPGGKIVAGTRRLANTMLAALSPAGRLPRLGDDSVDDYFILKSQGDIESMRLAGSVAFRDIVKPGFAAVIEQTPWGKSLLASEAPLDIDTHLPDSGITMVRRRGSHLVFAAGPAHDRELSHGHLHADAGSFELEVDSTPLFIDAGTYLYNYSGSVRAHFKGVRAHNTLALDECEPLTSAGTFEWEMVPRSRTRAFFKDPACVGAAVSRTLHAGTGTCSHRRLVLQVEDSLWVVVDHLAPEGGGGAGHEAAVFFHAPLEPAEVELENERSIGFRRGWRRLRGFASAAYAMTLVTDSDDRLTWYSPRYGELRHGTTVRGAAVVESETVIVHAIGSMQDGVEPEIVDGSGVTLLTTSGGRTARLMVDFGTPTIRFDDRLIGEDF